MTNILFEAIDWNNVPKTRHEGKTGFAVWQTLDFEGIRLRMVEYCPNYFANHWCKMGHIVHCLDGEFLSELETGEKFLLSKGMTYIVSDNLSSHRSLSNTGVKLLIIDGTFLAARKV